MFRANGGLIRLWLSVVIVLLCGCDHSKAKDNWHTFFQVSVAYAEYETKFGSPPPLGSNWIRELSRVEPNLHRVIADAEPFQINKVDVKQKTRANTVFLFDSEPDSRGRIQVLFYDGTNTRLKLKDFLQRYPEFGTKFQAKSSVGR